MAIPGLRVYRAMRGQPTPPKTIADALAERPGDGPVWMHASEPAEAEALRVLAHQLNEMPDAPDCLVTGSVGAPGPEDEPRAVDAFLDQHRPRFAVFAGSVLQPNLIERARARRLALFLVNVGAASAPGHWRLWPGFNRALLSAFEQIHTCDEDNARVLTRYLRGAVPVLASGTLARNPPAPACNHFELEAMRETLGGRPVWLAFSLPQPEVETALAAHSLALRGSHRLLMIVAPRDSRDGAALAARATELGFSCARRTLDDEITETTQVYVADAEDEPGLFLRLAQVCYQGGSLTRDIATPSALQAAALGSALVFGPYGDPADRAFAEQLRKVGGGRRIASGAELGEAVSTLLTPEIGAEAALRAWMLATEGSDATWSLARALCDWAKLNLRGRA